MKRILHTKISRGREENQKERIVEEESIEEINLKELAKVETRRYAEINNWIGKERKKCLLQVYQQ